MKCEILNGDCQIANNDCSECPFAEEKLRKETKKFLANSYVSIPNFEIIKDAKTKSIGSVWFGNPIAEVAEGRIKVRKWGL